MPKLHINIRPSGKYEVIDRVGNVVQRFDADQEDHAQSAAWLLNRNAVGDEGPFTVRESSEVCIVRCPDGVYNAEESLSGCGSMHTEPDPESPGFYECKDCGLYFALPHAVEDAA